MKKKTFEIKPDHCPHCGYRIDHSSVADTEEPRAPIANDISVCLECNKVSRWDDNLKLVAMTPEEVKALDVETVFQIEHAQNVIKRVKERYGRTNPNP